jgi:hypothetical protein
MHLDTQFLELEFLDYDNLEPINLFFLFTIGLKHLKKKLYMQKCILYTCLKQLLGAPYAWIL